LNIENSTFKQCSRCLEQKELSNFYFKHAEQRWEPRCKKCKRELRKRRMPAHCTFESKPSIESTPVAAPCEALVSPSNSDLKSFAEAFIMLRRWSEDHARNCK
jgi:hypothetical protein